MTFSETQFLEIISKINKGMNDLSDQINQVPLAANAAINHWYVPDFMGDAIRWCSERITELASWIWNKIKEALRGAAAPVLLFTYAYDWQDVRGIVSGVTGQLKPEAMPATYSWTGSAAARYKAIIKPQGEAANKISTIADSTATVLQVCALAGLLFYVAIGAVLVKFIMTMATAIAAFGSAVFSWAGAALVVEEAGVDSGLLWAAIGALVTLLGAQAHQLTVLHGEAIDNSFFPGGSWPNPMTASYGDGSVLDGDADWSVAG